MLKSGLPDKVADEEELARFLTQDGHFNKTMVRPAAFLPSRKARETSVSRHGREPLADLWRIGEQAAGERTLYGAAVLTAEQVRSVALEVVADEPPARHAAIRDWPWLDDDSVEQKSRQKELAVELASMAGKPLLKEQ